MLKPTLCATMLTSLIACGPVVQTSSGRDFVVRYQSASTDSLSEAVRAEASVKPTLRFPAKFGLARVGHGRLTALPADEMEIWRATTERYSGLGDFAPISPLLTAAGAGGDTARGLVDNLRLAAAKQHMDAVLVYEVGARSNRVATPFALADLSLIGTAVLPSRSLTAEGVASAVLLDVWNGYQYLTAASSVDLSRLSITLGARTREDGLRRLAVLRTVEDLVPKVEQGVLELHQRLQRLPRSPAPPASARPPLAELPQWRADPPFFQPSR